MKKRGPFKIGLTGSVGAGKSQVLEFLSQMGVPVLQTDEVGHQLLRQKKFLNKLVRFFGKGILGPKGVVERNRLSLKVFSEASQRLKLNRLLHPAIRQAVYAWVKDQGENLHFKPIVVVEVPLLFEGGFNRWFDGVLCVSAPVADRQKRLRLRGWSAKEIRMREGAQWTQKRKNAASDWVIYNHGTRKRLKYVVRKWFEMVQLRVPKDGVFLAQPMKIGRKG